MRGSKDCCNQPNTANRKVEVLGDGVEAVGVSYFCVQKRGHHVGEHLSGKNLDIPVRVSTKEEEHLILTPQTGTPDVRMG